MKTYTVVALSEHEAAVIKRVTHSLGVAYPEAAHDRKHHDSALVRAIHVCSRRGTPLSHKHLTAAQAGLLRQMEVCQEQSTVEYWRGYLEVREHVNAAPDKHVVAPTAHKGFDVSYGLVHDPEAMFVGLADTRLLQAQEATAALEVVQQALALATPIIEVSDDEEDY